MVHMSEFLQFDSKAKIHKAVDGRVRMLKAKGENSPEYTGTDTEGSCARSRYFTLNGIDAAAAPTYAKAIYTYGQRFTGEIKMTWDTLPAACDTDFCIAYSETDRIGDQHVVELLQALQAPPADRIAKIYDIFG